MEKELLQHVKSMPPSLLIENGTVHLIFSKSETQTYPYGEPNRNMISVKKEVYDDWIREEYDRIEDELETD